MSHLNFGGHNHIPGTADRLRRCQLSSQVSVINFWRSAAMLITSTVEFCIQQLGGVKEIVFTARRSYMLARSWESQFCPCLWLAYENARNQNPVLYIRHKTKRWRIVTALHC